MHYEAFGSETWSKQLLTEQKATDKNLYKDTTTSTLKVVIKPKCTIIPIQHGSLNYKGYREWGQSIPPRYFSGLQIIKKYLLTSETLYSMDKEISLGPAGAAHFRPGSLSLFSIMPRHVQSFKHEACIHLLTSHLPNFTHFALTCQFLC